MAEIHIPIAKTRPAPQNFAEIAPKYMQTELRKMFNCGNETVKRWCLECGVECRKPPCARRKGKISHDDPPELITACLTCPLPPDYCGKSACQRLHYARIAARKRKQAESGGGICEEETP